MPRENAQSLFVEGLPMPRDYMDADVEAQLQYLDATNADIRRGLYVYADPPRNIWQEMIDAANFCGDESVIDVGSGSGYFIERLLANGHTGEILGIDKFAKQFYNALQKIREEDKTIKVEFIEADAAKLPVPESRLDVGVSLFTWYHLPDAVVAARELKRAVKEDGTIIVSSRDEENQQFLWMFADQAAAKVGALRYESFYSRCNISRTREIVDQEFKIVYEDTQESALTIPLDVDSDSTTGFSPESPGWLKYKAAFMTLTDSMIDVQTGENLSKEQIAEFEKFADEVIWPHVCEEAKSHLERHGEAFFVDWVSQGYFIAKNSKKTVESKESRNPDKAAKPALAVPELVMSDWDDVYTNGSTYAYFICYRYAVHGVGISMSDDEIFVRMEKNWGKRHEIIIGDLLLEHPDLAAEAIRIYEDHLFEQRTFEENLLVKQGAAEVIGKIAAKATLTVISGINPIVLGRILNEHGINTNPDKPEIAKIVTGYDVPATLGKPNPYSAGVILGQFGVKPEKAIVVGDAPNDIVLGKRAHTQTAAVLTGHLKTREEASKYEPDYILADIFEFEENVLKKRA